MAGDDDPCRLTDDPGAPAELREILQSARSEGPTAAQMQSMLSGLLPLIPGGAPPGTSGPPPGSAAPGSDLAGSATSSGGAGLGASAVSATALKLGASLGAALALFGAGFSLLRTPASPPPADRAVASPSPAPHPAPLLEPRAPESQPPVENNKTRPAGNRESRPTPGVYAPRADEEARLLEQARAALGSSPTRALDLAREHQRRYATGALTQEREVIAIEALRRLGRDTEARERAQEFERRYPSSAHRRRVTAQD